MKQKQYLVINSDTLARETILSLIQNITPNANVHFFKSAASSLKSLHKTEIIDHIIIKIDSSLTDPVNQILQLKQCHMTSSILAFVCENVSISQSTLKDCGANIVLSCSRSLDRSRQSILELNHATVDRTLPAHLLQDNTDQLTQRQKQVMAYILKGRANKHIAWELGVSEGTIKLHVSSILRALKATNRTEAALKYQQRYMKNVNSLNLNGATIG